MSGLELNKIAAAVLVAGIVAMVTGHVAGMFYHPETEVEKRGYTIAGAEQAAEGDGAVSAEPAAPVDILAYLGAADPATGEAITKKCAACHDMSQAAVDKVGPHLWGVLGRDIASASGYAYSDGLKAVAGSWDYQKLSEFLTKPKNFAPGTKMVFAGLPKPEDRANLIMYLRSMGSGSMPIPAYTAPPAAAAAQDATAAAVKATLPASQGQAEAQREKAAEGKKAAAAAQTYKQVGKEPLSPAEQEAAKPDLAPAE